VGIRFILRFRSHPEALEPFLDTLRARGATEVNLTAVRAMLIAWRETYHDRAAYFPIDRYLAAGMGAVDLVMLPVVVPMGVPDRPLFLAHVSLAISLVLVAVSLFVMFVKHELGITKYGRVHGTMVELALASGAAALTATFWHSSSFVGTLFLILTVLAYVACVLYFVAAKLFVDYAKLLAVLNEPAAEASASSEPDEPHHPDTTDEDSAESADDES
jgi:hypothetical protein